MVEKINSWWLIETRNTAKTSLANASAIKIKDNLPKDSIPLKYP